MGVGVASYLNVIASEGVPRQVEVCEGRGNHGVSTECLTKAVHTCEKQQVIKEIKRTTYASSCLNNCRKQQK